MRTVEVEIFNACFTVREADNEAYLQALAAEVDARIQQIFVTSSQLSPLRAVTLDLSRSALAMGALVKA